MPWPWQAYRFKLFYLAGQKQESVKDWIEQCWQQRIKSRLFQGWLTALPWLQERNAHILLLSGTPRPLAEPLMRYFAIDYALCGEPEILHGFYTGRLCKPHPWDGYKYTYAQEWMQENGYTWQETLVIANDWPDRHVLSAGKAMVIRPGFRLTRLAQKKNWPVITHPDDRHEIVDQLALFYNENQ